MGRTSALFCSVIYLLFVCFATRTFFRFFSASKSSIIFVPFFVFVFVLLLLLCVLTQNQGNADVQLDAGHLPLQEWARLRESFSIPDYQLNMASALRYFMFSSKNHIFSHILGFGKKSSSHTIFSVHQRLNIPTVDRPRSDPLRTYHVAAVCG